MLGRIAANVFVAAMDEIKIVRDMGELHAAYIDAPRGTPDGSVPIGLARIEASTYGMQVVSPLLIRDE